MDRVQLGNRWIGAGEPCFIVAEAGSNHNGSFEQALRLIDVATIVGEGADVGIERRVGVGAGVIVGEGVDVGAVVDSPPPPPHEATTSMRAATLIGFTAPLIRLLLDPDPDSTKRSSFPTPPSFWPTPPHAT